MSIITATCIRIIMIMIIIIITIVIIVVIIKPGRMANLMELKLNEIGNALGNDKNLPDLGLYLGFTKSEVDMFLATNRVDGKVSPRGTNDMLFAWSNKTLGADQVRELRDALVAAKLGHVAERYLQ